jgi:hypothetical protein
LGKSYFLGPIEKSATLSLGSHGIKEDGVWEGKLGRILEVVLQNLAVEGFRKDV